jgi:aminopeptidase N
MQSKRTHALFAHIALPVSLWIGACQGAQPSSAPPSPQPDASSSSAQSAESPSTPSSSAQATTTHSSTEPSSSTKPSSAHDSTAHHSTASTPSPAPSHAAAATAATPGAAGIGDPLFPRAGNGGYDVESYDLAIALERVEGPIDASATIRAKSTQALSRFDFDLHGLDVHSIEVDGAPAKFEREEDELEITPARSIADGTEFTTVVRYGGVPEGVLDPAFPADLKLGWIVKDGEAYVLSEPTGAKTFFPCNDHPRDKALYAIRLTVPKPLVAVSNGALAETIDGGATRTFVYHPRDPIATYLVTIAIGAFEEFEGTSSNGVPIHNYYSPKTKASLRKNFERTDEIIRFLGDTFGAYPFEVCGNIASNLNLPGALETQTLPTYGVGVGGTSTICHELAHQWFGDTVSVENWGDIWLNEGFAEYAAWMYLESTKGREAFEKHVRGQYGFYRVMAEFEAPPARGAAPEKDEKHPRSSPPPGRPTIHSMFGASVYVRGPLALQALRDAVGDEKFLALMRSWVAQHKNGNASVGDFLDHVEHATSADARSVVEHWIFDEKMPHVAAWDDALAKEKAERDAKREERERERAKSKESDSHTDAKKKSDD